MREFGRRLTELIMLRTNFVVFKIHVTLETISGPSRQTRYESKMSRNDSDD